MLLKRIGPEKTYTIDQTIYQYIQSSSRNRRNRLDLRGGLGRA